MTNTPHEEFRMMFKKDFNTIQNDELVKYIFHNTDDLDIKNNIQWALHKCGEDEFLHDIKKGINLQLYSELKLRISKE